MEVTLCCSLSLPQILTAGHLHTLAVQCLLQFISKGPILLSTISDFHILFSFPFNFPDPFHPFLHPLQISGIFFPPYILEKNLAAH